MKKKDFLNNLAKIFEKEKINEKDTLKDLDFDSLIALDVATFNDANFNKMKQAYINKIEYYLPPKQENNKNLLKMAGKNNYKIKI